MRRVAFLKCLLGCWVAVAAPASAQQVEVGAGSVVETVKRLRPGEFIWAPEIAPSGPLLLIVNVRSQRAIMYRNGVPIGASTVSTGKPGYSTPTGVFTILQKRVEHYSSTYDNAPMPYMQRLTWRGVALHAGRLPGYPASHGCIRLPLDFAKLLYGVTKLGMTVVITDDPATPRLASPLTLTASDGATRGREAVVWQPQLAPDGPVSIVVSVADQKAIVLRNGVQIGSATVQVKGPVTGTWAYALRSVDATGQDWIRVPLSSGSAGDQSVPREEWSRFAAPEQFRRAVAAIVGPGTTVIITADSLQQGAAGAALTIIDTESAADD